jgi:D-inositol-3-phosphate glycosyltransferase
MGLLPRIRRRPRAAGWPPPQSFFREPRGYVDGPSQAEALTRGPVQFLGWCLIPGTSIARVDVSLNGGPPQRARIGIERLDLRDLCPHPDSPVCGFEHKCDLTELPETAREVVVEAVAQATDGRTLAIPPARFRLGDAPRDFEDADGRAAQLRARSLERLRTLPAHGARSNRMLVFTHQLDYSGGSLYLFELVRRLSPECEIVAMHDGPLRDRFEAAGMPVHIADNFPVQSVERYEANQAELMAWVRHQDFGVALVNTLGCFPGADAATRLGIPVVWAIHESFALPQYWFTAFPPGTPHPYVRERAEQSLRAAGAIVFEAEATRQLFLPYADDARLVTLPYGIELGEIDAVRSAARRAYLRRRLGVADGTRVVLALGTIEARKSQSTLVQAFAQVADRHPEAQLVLVGASDAPYCRDYVAAIRDHLERRGLTGRVRVEPVTPEPYSWHALADVLVCSSDVESLPRVIMEAMAFGTPVLSTRVFGIPELIEDGRTGYLCEPRDVLDLAGALDRVLAAAPAELERVAAAGAARVRERHDPDRYAGELERLLRTVAAAGRPALRAA